MKRTEYKLKLWREGQTNAERFAADLLLLDGFSSVSPQSPLGGPDGLKDVLCEKNSWSYIGAAYFPTTIKNYTAIKNKFKHDLVGVSANSADGIVFITNQGITVGQKKALAKIASNKGAKSIIYDNERTRVILDSPIGFALRLQYLRIKMNKEEQLAFFAQQQSKMTQLLNNQSNDIISAISKKIDDCCNSQAEKEGDLSEFLSSTQSTLNFVKDSESHKKSDKKNLDFPALSELTIGLKIDSLCNIHKQLMYGFNTPDLGKLRTRKVWIGSILSDPDKALYTPPPPEKVMNLTEELLSEWRSNYKSVLKSSNDNKIEAITKFHGGFLTIHPFMDGNGRMARFILNQQVSELLGIETKIVIEDKPSYFTALTEFQNGDYTKLTLLIKQAIYGEE